MAIFEAVRTDDIKPLFVGRKETFIQAYLQGHMGKAYVDRQKEPQSAVIEVGDFWSFAGKPIKELVMPRKEDKNKQFAIMEVQGMEWYRLIEEVHGQNAKKVMRYATKHDESQFDKIKLQHIVDALPKRYQLREIDEAIYKKIMASEWAVDLCGNFKGYEAFAKKGIGFVVLEDEEVLSGASSYAVTNDEIEIEVDTREDQRRKGLALCCSAALVLACLRAGKYPNWDAHNLESILLAKKLGYQIDREYLVYEVYFEQS